MAPKRPLEEGDAAQGPEAKKPRGGFKVGPENLPDGAWKRKVTKIKKDLIQKAKIKKEYAKIKAAELPTQSESKEEGAEPEAAGPHVHPERQAMLEEDNVPEEAKDGAPGADRPRRPHRQRQRRPGYYEKAMAQAERRKAEAEEREKEIQRRNEERNRKIADRKRFKKALVKARTPGRDGKMRLGRESGLLLEKVKKMVNEGN